jgi:thioredoxin reductase
MSGKSVTIVGAGASGCSAALEASRLGLRVTLIDEHPQSLQAMSLDAPYYYGARLPGVLDDASAIAERVLGASELLLECLEADVEILTGVCVWGSFRPGPNNTHMPIPQIGLADGARSWMLDYENLILATGARDLVLSFPGWELPGVLGALGAGALMNRYQALSGSKMIVLGSGNLALSTARRAIESGIGVAAIVERSSAIIGSGEIAAGLAQAGVALLTDCVIERVLGEQDVRGARLVKVDGSGAPIAGSAFDLACDIVCMGFGAVPNVELAAISGCSIVFDDERGGWAPALDENHQTSSPGVYVVGAAAGVDDEMALDPGIAAEQGRRAARAIARAAGLLHGDGQPAIERMRDGSMIVGAKRWLESLVAAGGMDVMVCQCESVTRRELLELSPPKYLGAGNSRASGGVGRLSPSGRASQDLVKRLTRAGMGHCQGKRCRDQVAMLLAEATGADLAGIVPGSYRAPVRPIPLGVMWAGEESEAMRRNWPIWLHPIDESAPGYAVKKTSEADDA